MFPLRRETAGASDHPPGGQWAGAHPRLGAPGQACRRSPGAGRTRWSGLSSQECNAFYPTPKFSQTPGEENGNPLQYSCLAKAMDRGAWRATVPGAAHTHFHQQKREIKFQMEKQPEHFWKPFSALHAGESALYRKRDTGFRCPSGGGGRREAPEGPRDWNPKVKHLSTDSSTAPGEASWFMFFPD